VKKNIVLVSGKTDYPPMGALYLADALEQAGYVVHLRESNEQSGNFLQFIKNTTPVFVGFSVHTWPTIIDMVDKSKMVKENTEIPVVWGGIHPTFVPEQCLGENFIDYIMMGEGEIEIVRLADDLVRGENLYHRCRQATSMVELDSYRPAWHLLRLGEYLFDASHSVRGNNTQNSGAERIFYYLMSSRGCPFNCTFCYNSHGSQLPWRSHSADWVKEQVLFLKKALNIDGIGFWDDFFLGNRGRAIEIIEFLHEQGVKFICEARATDLDDEFTAWLKEMGCLQVFIGAESGSDRVLKMINKKLKVSDILQAVEITHKHNLPARLSFIYGFPGETIDEMLQTKALANRLPSYGNVSISGPKLLTPYPGSLIYDQALEYGFVVPSNTAEWANINRYTDLKYLPWLSDELKSHNMQLGDLF
jgi:anaerobic magnesium-protoporphyrin IX monomethyl ester cyclase